MRINESKPDPLLQNQFSSETIEAFHFYDSLYDQIFQGFYSPEQIVTLGERDEKTCRFCGLCSPAVSFRSKAHAIPEMLGNKSLFTNYECDACNQYFGIGIENDLAEFTKPSRTLARVRGKQGIPTLKDMKSGTGFRIEYDTIFRITDSADSPITMIDMESKRMIFNIPRGPYTPVAVLKAFVKIGLLMLPESELRNFEEATEWVRSDDHSKKFIRNWPTYHSLQLGPVHNDLISTLIMRRKSSSSNVPYAFYILGFGNDVYQIFLPCPQEDKSIHAKELYVPPFPNTVHGDRFSIRKISHTQDRLVWRTAD